MSVVVLITLLIAMMSDTYQRIQVTIYTYILITFVRSDNESIFRVRAAFLRGVWSDDDRSDKSSPERQQHPASMDELLVQDGVRDLHAGVCGRAD